MGIIALVLLALFMSIDFYSFKESFYTWMMSMYNAYLSIRFKLIDKLNKTTYEKSKLCSRYICWMYIPNFEDNVWTSFSKQHSLYTPDHYPKNVIVDNSAYSFNCDTTELSAFLDDDYQWKIAKLETSGKTAFLYGYFSIIMKTMNYGAAYNMAFWLKPIHNWPPEIDIYEQLPANHLSKDVHKFQSTLHRGGNSKSGININRWQSQQAKTIKTKIPLNKTVNEFSCLWTWRYIKYYFNGILYYVQTNNIPNTPMYLQVNSFVNPLLIKHKDVMDNKIHAYSHGEIHAIKVHNAPGSKLIFIDND